MGIAGAMVVALAVLYRLTLLPALLAVPAGTAEIGGLQRRWQRSSGVRPWRR
jgi:uncharacterized membrane protein YdfJ with MMPL/SSD domain